MPVRLATVQDSAGLARVQVSSYQIAYRGLLPQPFLDQFTIEEQTQDWIDLLAGDLADPLYVAVDAANQVLGYALGRTPGAGDFDCELQALHVLQAHQRQGHGTALVSAIARHYAEAGCTSLMLWTLKHNPAMAMYEKLGGMRIDEKTDAWEDGTHVTEIAYGWHDLRALIRQQGAG